ncbi:hypothetical protein F9802_03265 [Bacillus aerolatus]|uniref:Uncharacterized protein n=1 Tax=Bacillus aerolatus TaxID=2653354 RepID=A0A6I1FPH4_9BACI|nr:hypothetical protein [Bacillus aerolatus]KAB7709141.1 hypothetical protein F9802_03265 [Bacillus aerolatus]
MNNKFIFFLLPALFIILIVASSFDFSSRKFVEEKNSILFSEQDSTLAIAESKEQKETYQFKNFELEEKIVGIEEADGYIIETYREYEVYKDKQGNVKEKVPTSNYSYIRYQKY